MFPRRKPPDFAELMLLQMKANSEQRDYVAVMRESKRRDADKRREDKREEAARVKEDDRNEAVRVRADKRSERVLNRTICYQSHLWHRIRIFHDGYRGAR